MMKAMICTLQLQLVCGYSRDPGSNSRPPLGERFLMGIPGIQEFASGYDILTGTLLIENKYVCI